MPWKRFTGEARVEKCAFAGCHEDIGGGYIDAGLSTVSLLWMVAKIQEASGAEFDLESLIQTLYPRPGRHVCILAMSQGASVGMESHMEETGGHHR